MLILFTLNNCFVSWGASFTVISCCNMPSSETWTYTLPLRTLIVIYVCVYLCSKNRQIGPGDALKSRYGKANGHKFPQHQILQFCSSHCFPQVFSSNQLLSALFTLPVGNQQYCFCRKRHLWASVKSILGNSRIAPRAWKLYIFFF